MTKTYKELIQEREALDKAIETALKAEKEEAIKSVRETIELFNLTAKDCGFKSSKTTKPSTENKDKPDGRSAPKKAKYRNPKNHNETWNGLGATSKRPVWVREYLATPGTKLEDLLIDPK